MNEIKKRIWLFIPYALLAFGFVGGTGAWFYGKDKVDEAIKAEITKQKANGIEIACDNRDIGGYPLKYIVTCAKFQVKKDDIVSTIDRAVFVGQVWNKHHVIAELHSPMVIKNGKQPETIMTFEPIMISMNGNEAGINRASSVFKATTIKNNAFEMSFADGEMHFLELGDKSKPNYKTTITLNNLSTKLEGKTLAAKAFKLNSDSELSSRPVSHKSDAFIEWFKAGGVMKINEFSFFADDYGLKIDGNAQLNAEKLLNGTMNLRLWGLEKLLAGMKEQTTIDPKVNAMLQSITIFAKKETIEGKNTHVFAFSSDKGQVKMQGLPIYNLPAVK